MTQVLIVLRAQTERTLTLSRAAAEREASKLGEVRVINERPFIRAVLRTFELGGQSAAPYLIGLDADVLLYQGSLEVMLEVAEERMDQGVFRIDFPILDKFRGRTTGVHFYNNKLSRSFLEHMATQENAGRMLRAESDNVGSFCKANDLDYALVNPDLTVACHDYFQYFSHLEEKYLRRYDRCLVDKNLEELLDHLAGLREAGLADADELLALAVLENCLAGQPSRQDMAAHLGLKEKGPMSASDQQAILAALPRIGRDLPDHFSALDRGHPLPAHLVQRGEEACA